MKPTFAQYAHFYLNTGLKIKRIDKPSFKSNPNEERILTMGIHNMKDCWTKRYGMISCMPMMRPLSSLTKEITNGVVPIVELAKMARFESDENNKAEFRGVGKPPYGYAPTKYKPHYDCWYQFRRGQAWNIIYDNRGLYVKESHHGWYESMAVNMPDLYQQLLKWHVNIFDISPDEFIEINESKTITGRKALKK